MEFNQFRYNKKHDTFRTLVNVYNFNKDEIDVYIRSDYKVVVSDNQIEDIVDIPERVKLESVKCHYVDDQKTLLMIELRLKDLDVNIIWNE
jgi:hypothetical protein